MNLQNYIYAFLIGGFICAIGQILIDKTKLTTSRILVFFVTLGVVLTAFGFYDQIVKIGGAGATVPLTGFGYSLAKGTFKEVDSYGLIGAFTGGLKKTAAGLSAAIFFGYIFSVTFSPKAKR